MIRSFLILLILSCLEGRAEDVSATSVEVTISHSSVYHRAHLADYGAHSIATLEFTDAVSRISSDNTFGRDVYVYSVVVPQGDSVVIQFSAANPQRIGTVTHDHRIEVGASITSDGLVGNQRILTIAVNPWSVSEQILSISPSFKLRIAWSQPLNKEASPPNPEEQRLPFLPVNAGWCEASRDLQVKSRDVPLGGNDANWFIKGRPYAKVQTAKDGVAVVVVSDLLTSIPQFGGLPTESLRLSLRGHDKPHKYIDTDGSGTVTAGDTLVFLGRRPFGDTTYWDIHDTVSTFWLTSDPAAPLTYGHLSPSALPATISSIQASYHVEPDSGHYHLGSHYSLDYGAFNTDDAPGQGYHWAMLHARSQDTVGWNLLLAPFRSSAAGDTARLTYMGVTSIRGLDTIHELTFSVNNTLQVVQKSHDYDITTLIVPDITQNLVAGNNRFTAMATGPSLDSKPPQSIIIVDHANISLVSHPYLLGGRLHGTVVRDTVSDGSGRLRVSGINGNRLWLIDTTEHRIAIVDADKQGVTVRSGAYPSVASNGPTAMHFDVTVALNESIVSLPGITNYALVWMPRGGNSVKTAVGEWTTVTNQISGLNANDVGVLFWKSADNALTTFLRNLGISGTIPPTGIVAWSPGKPATLAGVSSIGTISLTDFIQTNDGRTGSVCIDLGKGPSSVIFAADQTAIERARIHKPLLQFLRDSTPQADIVYIVHPDHKAAAMQLARHREEFTHKKVFIADINAICDEFGFGRKTPWVVKNFLKTLYSNSVEPKPRYLLLIGNASFDPRMMVKTGNLLSRLPDQVPSYGRPSSDVWYGNLFARPHQPELIVGRLPVVSATEAAALVEKIIKADTIPFDPWMRKFMFVGGGYESEGLCDIYKTFLGDPYGTGINIINAPLCADTGTVCRYELGTTNGGFVIRRQMNTGTAWLNFIGHGASSVFDIPGWNPEELDNEGRNGFLATYACQTGAFTTPSERCKNAEYVVHPRNGFIAAVGGTGWTYLTAVSYLHFAFHDAIRSGRFRYFGDIVFSAISRYGSSGTKEGTNTLQQHNILGDPLSRVRIDTIPDLYIMSADVVFKPPVGKAQITEDLTTVNTQITVRNAGVAPEHGFHVLLVREFKQDKDTIRFWTEGSCGPWTFDTSLTVNQMAGEHRVTIIVDPEGIADMERRHNNTRTTVLRVFGRELLAIQPQKFWTIKADIPFFRVMDPEIDSSSKEYHFSISERIDTGQVYWIAAEDEVVIMPPFIDWIPQRTLPPNKDYVLTAYSISNTNAVQPKLEIPFSTTQDNLPPNVVKAKIPAHAFTDKSTTLFDSVYASLVLPKISIPVRLSSFGKSPTTDEEREQALKIGIGSINYVEEWWRRGVNIAIMQQWDTIPSHIRWYDTFYAEGEEPIPVFDGYTQSLITFLRDSVPDGATVLFATCNEWTRGSAVDNLRHELDSVLRQYGSSYAGSFGSNSSWAMIGKKGAISGSVPEAYKDSSDVAVTLEDVYSFRKPMVSMYTGWIEPARSFTEAYLHAQAASGMVAARINGRDESGTVVDIEEIPGNQWAIIRHDSVVTGISANVVMTDSVGIGAPPRVYAMEFKLIPASEWHLEMLPIKDRVILRGDSVTIESKIANAYHSYSNESVEVSMSAISNPGGEIVWYSSKTVDIQLGDSATLVSFKVPTATLSENTTLRVFVDPIESRKELYRFNNTATHLLRIIEDSIPPRIKVTVNGRTGRNKMQVPINSVWEVRLLDNSNLPIGDSNRLSVFVNGDRIRPAVASDYKWVPTAALPNPLPLQFESDVKAVLQFSYPLEPGQNNLLVRASDATGNEAEFQMSVFTTDERFIEELFISPSPGTGPMVIGFDVVTSSLVVTADIAIFDIQGRQVWKRQGIGLTNGRHRLLWNGVDNDRGTLSSSTYFLRLTITESDGHYYTLTRPFVIVR